MITRLKQRALVLLTVGVLIATLSGCATVGEARYEKPTTLQQFVLEARLTIRVQRPDETPQNASGQLAWRHEGAQGRDHLQIFSPFGHTLADLRKQPGLVTLKLANGRQFESDSLKSLARDGLGYGLPFDDLPAWLEGRGSPQRVTTFDAQGRPSELTDAPWTVRYTYPDAQSDSLPSRLELHSTEGLDLSLRVERWLTGTNFPPVDEAL